MYSMPIVGTNAELYFPNECNDDPIVIGCVRTNGSSCEKFSDTSNRYFATESDNNLDLLPNAVNLSRPGMNINLHDSDGITLSSSSNMYIGAPGITLNAGKVTISGDKNVTIDKDGVSTVKVEGSCYTEAAGVVFENGSDRTPNAEFTDDDLMIGMAVAAVLNIATAAIAAAITGINAISGTVPVPNEQCEENTSVNEKEVTNYNKTTDQKSSTQSNDKEELPTYNPDKNYNEGDRVKLQANGKEFPATIRRNIFSKDMLYPYADDQAALDDEGEILYKKAKPTEQVTGTAWVDAKVVNSSLGESQKLYMHAVLKGLSGDEEEFEGLSEAFTKADEVSGLLSGVEGALNCLVNPTKVSDILYAAKKGKKGTDNSKKNSSELKDILKMYEIGSYKTAEIPHSIMKDLKKYNLDKKVQQALQNGYAKSRFGSSGIIKLTKKEIEYKSGNTYTYKLKVPSAGDHLRVYGYVDNNGTLIFDYITKGKGA